MKSTYSNIGDYYLFTLSSSNTNNKPVTPISNFLLIDNSGSMGCSTLNCINTIGASMLDLPIPSVPGELILFDDKVKVYPNIKSSTCLSNISIPRQGMTDITTAIKTCINNIIKHNQKCHYIMTFLSDGGHNTGPKLTDNEINNMRQLINKHNILLSIIVVGIDSNDTSLGMKIKTGLETVPLHNLESVYYGKNYRQLNETVQLLINGCTTSLNNGTSANISVSEGSLVENNKRSTTVFFADKHSFVVKSSYYPKLFVDNQLIEAVKVPVNTQDLALFLQYVLPKLSQVKLAHGTNHINTQIKDLEQLILEAESILDIVEELPINIGLNKSSASDRVKLLKSAKKTSTLFREERNKLLQLRATVSNDSAQQAEYLSGFTKKFASKAVLRSNTVSISLDDVLDEITALIPKLKEELNQCNFSDDTSLLSLNTSKEQLEEWLDFDCNQFTDIYSLLVYFGFSCYPVKFEHTNAVQMDPFQTDCKFIEPYMMDTCNLMLANQIGHEVTSPSRTKITDGLILFDTKASLLLKNTNIYKYLASVTLCRDLYMYHPRMTFAQHAHALKKAVDEYHNTKSFAYLNLAQKIIYSFNLTGERNDKLFNHWWVDWEGVTQSEYDACSHPIQLPLLLAVSNISKENYQVPFYNYLNEVLARKMKIIFAHHDNQLEAAVSTMLKLFGIDESNSPNPDSDVLTEEPTLVSVRESCQFWAEVTNTSVLKQVFNANSIKNFMDRELLPYIRLFEFVLGKNTDKIGDNTLNTMFLQAVLHHTNQTRVKIVEKSVLDSNTFHDLIKDLRMSVYLELCKVKKEEWLKIIGDATYAEALQSDYSAFSGMIGLHTHGLQKSMFWSLLKAAMEDDGKLEIFESKSNDTITNCYNSGYLR